MTVTHADFTIERDYPWTPAQTFSAFADPRLKRQWFGRPDGDPDAAWELDFRIGGEEVNRGPGPGGVPVVFRSRYHDIVPDERIVYAYDLELDGRLVSVSLATIQLHPDGGGTRLVFTEHGAFLDGLDDPSAREHGTGKLVEAMERVLRAELDA